MPFSIKYLRRSFAIISLVTMFIVANTLMAQHPISVVLQNLLENGDFDAARKAIKVYSVNELSELPDSVLFDYYYLQAAIKGNEGKEDSKRKYLLAAKSLCEKSQGIHSPVYLELCWAIGKSFEESRDTISAFEIYQAALIQSIGLYSLQDDDVKWQYEDIENKVIAWYKNKNLRSEMIKHRTHLSQREIGEDAVQNDMEFYLQFYQDDHSKLLISKADSLSNINRWDEAAVIYIEVAKNNSQSPIAKATLQELAAMNYINSENFQQAEELLLDNIQILENYRQTKTYRRTLSQLSNLYNAIHNYSKAKDYAGQAKFWYEHNLDFSRGYILCLHRCATLERGNQNYFLALLIEDVVLQELYRNKVLGTLSGSPTSREAFLANILSSAALHYNQFGFRSEAYENLEEAIKVAESNGLDASPYYSNMAEICVADKDFDRAVTVEETAYRLSRSDNNKIQIGTGLCLSQFLARQSISSNVVKECSNFLQSLVQNTFAFTSIEERQAFWSYFEYYFPLLNFLAYQTGNENLYGQIYNNILIEKGLLLRTANELRDQILNSNDRTDIEAYNTMLRLRSTLPSLSNQESDSIKLEIERLDKHLTRKYSAYSGYTKGFETTWEYVQNSLKDDEIAIEFYNIPQVSWHEDGSDVDGKYRYCAITLRKDYQTPHIIPLFTEDELDGIDREDFYDTLLIYHLIWKPLEQELTGVRNVYFAADRELHKIGIEYAPISDMENIGDRYNIYRLFSTRILAENKTNSKKETAVLYGGLKYDLGKDELIAESRSGDYHPTSTSRAFSTENSRYGVKYLPGTLKEVEEISHNFSTPPRLITDVSGTEESFKSLAGSSTDIIHLATHGFFWSNEDAKKRDYVTFLNPNNKDKQSNEDRALMRSGLFFSGANIGLKGETLPDDVEDGVLTALELSNMNLGNVDMVVMSACESGLGETSGEGVFGLQRGFKLAGANTLLMSLWKVDDTATQILMTEFYKNYLSGNSKQESLRLAQKSLRSHSEYSDPKYWAAFILLDGLN